MADNNAVWTKAHYPEVLAPVGDFERLTFAVNYGADAVYLGWGEFNARRNAQNLGLEELERICRLAHLGGQRIYLTVNTVLAGEELPRALALIDQAWRAGIDAVIVQDLGLLKLLTETMPQVEVHASTQMNIQDARGVELLARLGARRVTLARELSLEELSGLPEYATIKEVVSDKLRAASVEHHIIPGEGRDWLLFKVEDAPEVDEAFRQLEQETGKAADRARERLSEIAERRQEPERLAERAERAREASRAHSQDIGRERGPRQIEGPER